MPVVRGYLRSAGALTAQALVVRVVGMASSVVLARGLGAAGLGTYSALINTGNTVYGLLRLGTDAGIHVLTAEGDATARGFARSDVFVAGFLLLSLSGALGALLCVGLAPFLAESLYGDASLIPWLTLASALVLGQCFGQFFYAALAGMHQFSRYAAIMGGGAIVGFALMAAGLWLGHLKGALLAAIATQWLTTLALAHAFLALPRQGIDGIARRSTRILAATRAILKLGVPFYIAGLVALPVYYVGQGQLAQLAGLDAIGHLRVIQAVIAYAVTCSTIVIMTSSSHLDPGTSRTALASMLVVTVGAATLLSCMAAHTSIGEIATQLAAIGSGIACATVYWRRGLGTSERVLAKDMFRALLTRRKV